LGQDPAFNREAPRIERQQARWEGVMNPEHWEMEFYEDEDGREPCKDFIEHLSEAKAAALRSALVFILARQGPNVCETEFGKALKGGLFEFRLRHNESAILARVRTDLAIKVADATAEDGKILLRVFFHPFGDKILLLIGGYDKGKQPKKSYQDQQIRQARAELKKWEKRQSRTQRQEVGVPQALSFRPYWKNWWRNRKRG